MSPERAPLRVAYPVSSLRIGGAELRALGLAERLPRDRFEIDFLSFAGAGPLDRRGREAGARIHHLGSEPVGASPLPAKVVGRLRKLARYTTLARGSRYDIINAWLYPMDVLTVLGRPLTATPIIVAGRFDLLPRNAFGRLSARVDTYVNRRVDAIVANSQAAAAIDRGRRGLDPAKLRIIRNGVELADPIASEERDRIRADFGAGREDVLIGSVGMLREVKRHALLVDAFATLVPGHPRLRLAIVGEGPMRIALERQVRQLGLESRVRLPGAIADARRILESFDVIASSSRSEGLPNALLEGAAAGRPIVTTAAGGATEAVLDGITGFVVPVEDQAALTGALAKLVDDPQLRLRFGAAARDHMAATFGMERYVNAWMQLYEELAAARGLRRP